MAPVLWASAGVQRGAGDRVDALEAGERSSLAASGGARSNNGP